MEDCIWQNVKRGLHEIIENQIKKQPRNVAGTNRDSSQLNGRLHHRLFFFFFPKTLQYIWFSNLR